MNRIGLLATISEAASSVDPRIREQVPAKFHRSQTLVLCPSAVVQNWADEFALWAPKDHHLGSIWEIISGGNVEIEERFDVIMTWAEEGGVLIISYDLFRILVTNKSTRPTHRILSDEQHELAKDALLNRPTIVVADEAHKLKNEKSAISQVASRFSTLSRIAMTGSPLANHLSEYYQMVGWVAPGYLEDAATFKTKFVDPIQSGSYLDSTVAQQRESLCALKILNGILKPKVLRADTSVIAADLPSKTEFVIRIPLTRLQEEAYNTFVSAAQAGDDADTRLYTWLAILQLCCNHPQPFLEKLADRAKQPEDTEGSVLSGTMSESGLPTDLLSRVNEIFKDTRRIEDPSLSHRASLLGRILEESIKIGDKVLIFTQSVPTLNYIHIMLTENRLKFQRIDGHTPGADRQAATKRFNAESDQQILLISTKAGGVGLNMFGANRVVIFDFLFNPTWEDQAVGRAYRLGQTKPVFVYRFLAGGTFEENIYNKAVFKRQLAVRVVDKKNVVRQSSKNSPTLLHPVQPVERQDHSEILGKDTVLDTILAGPYRDIILDVSVSHIQDNENDRLTEAESRRVDDELKMERLKRSNPQAFDAEMKRRHYAEIARQKAESVELYSQRQAAFVAAGQKHTANNQMLDYSYGLGAPSQHLGMVRYQQPLCPKPPNFQTPSGGGQSTLAGDLSSALSRVPTAHGHAIFPPRKHTYVPSSTSLVSGPPGYSKMPSHMGYAPSRSSLHQICPEDSKTSQAFNRPGAEGLPFIPTADGSADSPVEIIDLSTPREGSPEIDDAREDDEDGDAPMDMSEDEAEPTPAKSPLPGP